VKNLIFIIGFGWSLSACVQHPEKKENLTVSDAPNDSLIISYAKGFEVEYLKGCIKVITKSIPGNQFFKDSLYIRTGIDADLSPDVKVVSPLDLRIACQSSTYLAYLKVLDEIPSVCGVCGLDYVVDQKTIELLKEAETKEICPGDQIDLEALFIANPTLFFTYPFGLNDESEKYTKQGIPTLLIAEYLEESQLARLEWIKLVGLLTGNLAKANAYFAQVEADYLKMRIETPSNNKTFIMNLPFQDEWYMPAANSVGVELIEDAGLTYFYKSETGTENKLHSKEEVWNDGVEADYWIIIARENPEFSLKELCAQSPIYAAFKSVKEGQVIFCNTAVVDYFASGVVEPHIILKDLLFATNQIETHHPRYFFRLE